MATKSKAKTKPSLKDVKENRRALLEKANEKPALSEGTGIGDECDADLALPSMLAVPGLIPPEPVQLTLPLLADSATLFIQGLQQLTAEKLGTPECAPLLVSVNGWLEGLSKVKKLIVGDDDEISGLKKLVIETGQPWGEKGSKQLTLAGAVVKVKAVNHRDAEAALTISDLDAAKVEAYLRGVPWTQPIEKVLACYMKPTTSWGLKDLPPQQQTNLQKMLADPGEDGQGLRQCLKDTKYQMMAPTMGDE